MFHLGYCLVLIFLSPYHHLTANKWVYLHTRECTHTHACKHFLFVQLEFFLSWYSRIGEHKIGHRNSERCGWGSDQDYPSIYECGPGGPATDSWLWFCFIALEVVWRVLFYFLVFLLVLVELTQGLEGILPPAFGKLHFENFSWYGKFNVIEKLLQ